MKLYLSSYRLGNDAQKLRALVRPHGRAAIVLNACDVFADRLRVYDREAEDMRSLGFEAEELDLRAFFGGIGNLPQRLDTYSLVWVVGGNAFVLARAMTSAGFAQAEWDRLASGSLVYAGYSAGACVTGPDLRGIELMDVPDVIPDGYSDLIPARTLGWVPWRMVPHWRSEHPEAANADRAVRFLASAGLAHRALRDGEAIVIDGDPERT